MPVVPEQKKSLITHYKLARRYMHHVTAAQPVNRLAFNTMISPHWIEGGSKCWYEQQTPQGRNFRMLCAETGCDDVAFDHRSLATALSIACDKMVDQHQLPLSDLAIKLSPLFVNFTAFGQRWSFDGLSCEPLRDAKPFAREVSSPDGKFVVFEREQNLWLRSVGNSSIDDRYLTEDGEIDFAYGATPNMVGAGQVLSGLSDLQVLWSPDSKKLLALQLDMRQVRSLPVVHHVPSDGCLRPQLDEYKYPMPDDAHIPEYRLVVIDIGSGDVTVVDHPPICFSFIFPFITDGRAWWSPDGETVYLVDIKRGAQQVQVIAVDTKSGKTRVLFEENSSTWINLHPCNYHGSSLFMPLLESQELIWYSERSGWAHLYLYDLMSGELKKIITQGEWVVHELLRFDSGRRELWLQTGGRTRNHDPYYKDICRINIDNGELTEVVASDHNYYAANGTVSSGLGEPSNAVSPNFDYIFTTRTRADQAPETFLFDRDGKELMLVEKADVSRLPENWQWPEPVKLKADDDKTDIYGLVFRPSHFSPEKVYPVIDCSFAYRSGTMVSKGFAQSHHFMYSAALAELGFIVVQIDGRGSPMRSRAFLDHGDGSLTSASDLADHIAGLKQLAERYPYIDLDRVGAFGGWTTSAMAINALLQYPEFYKVGVTSGMPQSQLYMALCSEPFKNSNRNETSFVQPEHLAHKLEGKLLMIHGMLDILDAPAATFRMVEAFQKANKDFDLLLLPNQQHGSGWANPYIARRILDFFVCHLLGEEPPAGFDLAAKDE